MAWNRCPMALNRSGSSSRARNSDAAATAPAGRSGVPAGASCTAVARVRLSSTPAATAMAATAGSCDTKEPAPRTAASAPIDPAAPGRSVQEQRRVAVVSARSTLGEVTRGPVRCSGPPCVLTESANDSPSCSPSSCASDSTPTCRSARSQSTASVWCTPTEGRLMGKGSRSAAAAPSLRGAVVGASTREAVAVPSRCTRARRCSTHSVTNPASRCVRGAVAASGASSRPRCRWRCVFARKRASGEKPTAPARSQAALGVPVGVATADACEGSPSAPTATATSAGLEGPAGVASLVVAVTAAFAFAAASASTVAAASAWDWVCTRPVRLACTAPASAVSSAPRATALSGVESANTTGAEAAAASTSRLGSPAERAAAASWLARLSSGSIWNASATDSESSTESIDASGALRTSLPASASTTTHNGHPAGPTWASRSGCRPSSASAMDAKSLLSSPRPRVRSSDW
mmetsp:Transcript_11264/g.35965  ORF Transcript_11264/g.35965 Transcript_11264/m.35965 type:complete len:464 (-) Transcript_11264:661-2052(-)